MFIVDYWVFTKSGCSLLQKAIASTRVIPPNFMVLNTGELNIVYQSNMFVIGAA
jgi:hypothetical protein